MFKKLVLVTGGSGLVGEFVQDILIKNQEPFVAPSRKEFDLLNPTIMVEFLEKLKPHKILHLAAETNVDLCEVQRSHAISANLHATTFLADYCRQYGAKLMFVSTSGTLSGNNKMISSEIDMPSPANFYSLTKFRAEEYIQKACKDYLIVRASWMVGKSKKNKKFAEKIASQIMQQVEEIKAVYDLYGSLTCGRRLAEFICQNINTSSRDVVHCASNTVCSRYELAKYIKRHTRSKTIITPVSSAEFPLSAPRGFSEGLSSEIARDRFGYSPLTWEGELDFFLKGLNA